MKSQASQTPPRPEQPSTWRVWKGLSGEDSAPTCVLSALYPSLRLGHLPPESSLTFLVRSALALITSCTQTGSKAARKRCAESPGGGFTYRGHQTQPANVLESSLQPGTSEREPLFGCLFLINYLPSGEEGKQAQLYSLNSVGVSPQRLQKSLLISTEGEVQIRELRPY